MATTEPTERTNRNAIALYVLLGLVAVAVAVAAVAYLSRPAQMGASEEVFHTVDALYTAVRNRDEARVSECERRLSGYRDGGQLPAGAADELGAIVAKAKGGAWETAAERLYDFMRAQKREGGAPRPPKAPRKATK